MCELYGLSSSKAAQVKFSLNEFRQHGGRTGNHIDGWGLAYIQQRDTKIYREPGAAALSEQMGNLIEHHEPAQVVISHIRRATQGRVALENTQPYTVELANRTHIFVHNGNLENVAQALPLTHYQMQGETDSEHAFGYLVERLERLWSHGPPSLEDRLKCIRQQCNLFDTLGTANFIYHDGDYLYAFANERQQAGGRIGPPGLWFLRRHWGPNEVQNYIPGIAISGESAEQFLVASVPLTNEMWLPMYRNQLLVAKDGELIIT